MAINFQQAFNAPSSPWVTLSATRSSATGRGRGGQRRDHRRPGRSRRPLPVRALRGPPGRRPVRTADARPAPGAPAGPTTAGRRDGPARRRRTLAGSGLGLRGADRGCSWPCLFLVPILLVARCRCPTGRCSPATRARTPRRTSRTPSTTGSSGPPGLHAEVHGHHHGPADRTRAGPGAARAGVEPLDRAVCAPSILVPSALGLASASLLFYALYSPQIGPISPAAQRLGLADGRCRSSAPPPCALVDRLPDGLAVRRLLHAAAHGGSPGHPAAG